MSEELYDVIVVGLGAMGSGSFYHAAKAGKSVLGIEQFSLGHTKGSSHGETRIIREAYFEGEFYVHMAQESAKLWLKLEEESGVKLYEKNGCLISGESNSIILNESKKTADIHKLPYTVYDDTNTKTRVPGWECPKGFTVIFDESAGLLYPEKCIEQHIAVAQKLNPQAKTLFNTSVKSYFIQEDGTILLTTTEGAIYHSKQLIISAGLYATDLIKDMNLPLKIQKNTVVWFENIVDPDNYSLKNFPCFLADSSNGLSFYGFPDAVNTGVKVGIHQYGPYYANPSEISFDLEPNAIQDIRDTIAPFLPTISTAKILKHAVCFYTLTPDHNFIIDFHPKSKNIVVLSPCSGHGFKFSSVIGKFANELLNTQENPHGHFKIDRFNQEQKQH